MSYRKKHFFGLKLDLKWANTEGKRNLHHWAIKPDGSLDMVAAHAAAIDLAALTKGKSYPLPNCLDYDQSLSSSISDAIPTTSAAAL